MSKLNNHYQCIARLGSDPESGKFQDGTAWARVNVAINDSYKGKDGEWVDRTVWATIKATRYQADRIAQMSKGDVISLSGCLKMDTWQDKQSGQNRTKLYIEVSHCKQIYLRPVESEAASMHKPAPSTPVPQSVVDGGDDDLPF